MEGERNLESLAASSTDARKHLSNPQEESFDDEIANSDLNKLSNDKSFSVKPELGDDFREDLFLET